MKDRVAELEAKVADLESLLDYIAQVARQEIVQLDAKGTGEVAS